MNQILFGQRFDDQSSTRFKNLGDHIGIHASTEFHRTIALQAGSSAAIRQVSSRDLRQTCMEPLVFFGLCGNPYTVRMQVILSTLLVAVIVPAEPRVVHYDDLDEDVEQVGVVHSPDNMAAQGST